MPKKLFSLSCNFYQISFLTLQPSIIFNIMHLVTKFSTIYSRPLKAVAPSLVECD